MVSGDEEHLLPASGMSDDGDDVGEEKKGKSEWNM